MSPFLVAASLGPSSIRDQFQTCLGPTLDQIELQPKTDSSGFRFRRSGPQHDPATVSVLEPQLQIFGLLVDVVRSPDESTCDLARTRS